jgi:uncharacterized protein YabE (DUF348 family)
VKGSYVVAGIKTKVIFEYDGDKYRFETYKTNLSDALAEQGIAVHDQDVFNISRDSLLKGGEVSVRAIKSWPVTIEDDGKIIHGRTTYEEPIKILEQNKVQVWPEDIVESELVLNPATVQGAGNMVRIRRAPVYYVLVDGKKKEVRSWEREVGTIIEKSATRLNPNDIVSPKTGERISSGSEITITRINYADISNTESIPFDTIYEGSTSLAFGKIKAIISGITGSKRNTYRITYKDGEEISRKLISSTVTQSKRDAKILRGAIIGKASFVGAGVYAPMSTAFRGYKGRYLLVTNLGNGKSVRVKVVDYGPQIQTGRIIDLSKDAFAAIANTSQGVISSVRVELLD